VAVITSGSIGWVPSCHGACKSKPRATLAPPLSHTVGRGGKTMPIDGPLGPPKQHERGSFPKREEYTDCAGVEHVFEISLHEVPTGWVVMATEVEGESSRYEFKGFSPVNEYLALAAVRSKIRRALAVKYLEGSPGRRSLSHDVMRGTILYDSEAGCISVLVDGQVLSLDEFQEILAQYEGWEFNLEIIDD